MDAGILAALATLDAEPDNADALATLSSLIEGGGNGKGAQQAASADTAVRRALKDAQKVHKERGDFERAKILGDELLREEEALRSYQRVLELRPDDEAAEDAIGHVQLVRDNWA